MQKRDSHMTSIAFFCFQQYLINLEPLIAAMRPSRISDRGWGHISSPTNTWHLSTTQGTHTITSCLTSPRAPMCYSRAWLSWRPDSDRRKWTWERLPLDTIRIRISLLNELNRIRINNFFILINWIFLYSRCFDEDFWREETEESEALISFSQKITCPNIFRTE